MDSNQFSTLAILVSASVAVAALLSPIITNFFNNRHQLKLKKLDIADKATKEYRELVVRVFENYLRTTFKYLKVKAATGAQEYGEAYGNILLYATREETDMLNHCDDLIQKRNIDNASELLREIAEVLRQRVKPSNEEAE
jgi:hypothetical protein